MVLWLFLAVPWLCQRFVIVVFPDHTHLLFSSVQDLQVILKWHNLLSLDKALDFFIEQRVYKSDFTF